MSYNGGTPIKSNPFPNNYNPYPANNRPTAYQSRITPRPSGQAPQNNFPSYINPIQVREQNNPNPPTLKRNATAINNNDTIYIGDDNVPVFTIKDRFSGGDIELKVKGEKVSGSLKLSNGTVAEVTINDDWKVNGTTKHSNGDVDELTGNIDEKGMNVNKKCSDGTFMVYKVKEGMQEMSAIQTFKNGSGVLEFTCKINGIIWKKEGLAIRKYSNGDVAQWMFKNDQEESCAILILQNAAPLKCIMMSEPHSVIRTYTTEGGVHIVYEDGFRKSEPPISLNLENDSETVSETEEDRY